MWRAEGEIDTLIRESAAAFADDRHDLARLRKPASGVDRAIWTGIAEMGWTGILLSESDGGSGLPLSAALVVAEMFGRRLLPEPFIENAVIAATVLALSDTALARACARRLATGEGLFSLAHGEATAAGHQDDPLSTTARIADGMIVLHGDKASVPGWSDGVSMLVTADHDGDLAIVMVPADSAGITATSHAMADGSVTADVRFDGVTLPQDHFLARGPAARDMVTLAMGRGLLAVSAQLEGLAQSMLAMTIDYVGQRVQFGRPLASNQALQHHLVNLFGQMELAGASWRSAATLLGTQGAAHARGPISRAKARCSDMAMAIAKAAIQYHGAFGYTEEADVGLYVNAALRHSAWLGNASTHREQALRAHEQNRISS
ncbi:acyl-CoA dehydrogenase family protein [Sphingobium sp. YBL2]|uniref:acyl-CoA dehydrogenase family protein n=1 Tax=Sphingobium sp. (strain YBL2) TaxID=484429 RepID=UPI0005CB90C1|nr:acyl-CoA dehydrogenase family protein [Sphingobium sp. YBL2]AJR24174.1 hypothetical protein TZ53_10985 [Sphingobium sp. YBL2]